MEAWALAHVEAPLKYHPGVLAVLTVDRLSGHRTMSGGQFDWGGRLPKGNGGVQSCPQAGWKPAVEYKGTRAVYCETNRSSSCESRA